MRVLFAAYSEKTHFQPMVSLAWALRTAGHEVCVASQPELTDTITQTGLTAVPVGRDHNLWRSARRFLAPRVAELSPETYNRVRGVRQPPFGAAGMPAEEVTWEYLKDGYETVVRTWYKIVNEPMLEDLVAFARSWRPDLVLWETATYAAPIAAKVVGAVHARVLCNLDMYGVARDHYTRLKNRRPPDDRPDALVDWLTERLAGVGAEFSEDLTLGHFTIDQHADSFRMEADLHYLPVRYVPYNGPAVVPRWLWEPPRRPRVCLCLGSSSTDRFDGYAVGVATIIEALADLDIELIATLPDHEREKLTRIPDNTRIVPFIALNALAPTCSVAIHHGAFGTANTIALYGVPQLALPERHDAPMQAERLIAYGAGLAIDFREATGERVRDGVVRLLTEPSFRERAAQLRKEMLTMPTPNEVVPVLEALVARYRPRPDSAVSQAVRSHP